MENVKVLIVDDHGVVCKGLKLLLGTHPAIEVIGDAPDAEIALEKLTYCVPDVLLTDITMPGMSGIDLVKEVRERYPHIKCIVLSMHLDGQYISAALDAGAQAYLPKETSEDYIVEAVLKVARGETYLTSKVSEVLARRFIHQQQKEKSVGELTKRELEILELIVSGKSNKMVADDLFISEKTVSVHRYNLMKKMGAKNTADIVRITMENRLLEH